ncbi:hypothetical protein [Sphingomonas sp. KR3-1]|uniref:hypothetical protein n=1 Tax=Sphingomonas sp. KR3-1 TaxID=3156611 RepID=UPI0032B5167C
MSLVLAFLLSFAPPPDFPDPIAPAARGELQCHRPDRARHICQSLAGYRIDAKGGFLNDAEVLISAQNAITMRTVTPVEIRDGAICGAITRVSLEKAVFLAAGQPLAPDKAESLRASLLQNMATLFDHEICTRYSASGDHLVAQVTLDGVAIQDTMDLIWVRPDEGYRVAG